MAKFKYAGRERTTESIMRAARSSGGAGYLTSEGQFWKPKEGENIIRVLPPPVIDGELWGDQEKWGDMWAINIFLHFDVGPDGGAFLCLDKMQGKRCPICEARREARNEEERDALNWQRRPLAMIIDRNDEKSGPQVFGMPFTKVYKEILNRSVDRKTNKPILIDDPDNGFDVVFTREGSGKKTQYTGIEVLRESSPLHDNEKKQDRWLQQILDNPLPDLLQFHPAEHIEDVLFGKKGDDDEDERPRSRRRSKDEDEEDEKPRSRRRGRDEDEEDEEDEKPRSKRRRSVDEDEDEDEKPRSRRKSRDEDEDEEEEKPRRRGRASDDDEEEEEEKPRKRRSAKDDDEDEEEEKPRRRGRAAKDEDEEDEEEEKPSKRRSRGGRGDDDEEEEEEEKPRKRRRAADPDDDIPSDGEDDEEDGAKKHRRLRSRRDK